MKKADPKDRFFSPRKDLTQHKSLNDLIRIKFIWKNSRPAAHGVQIPMLEPMLD